LAEQLLQIVGQPTLSVDVALDRTSHRIDAGNPYEILKRGYRVDRHLAFLVTRP
jgi:hypothetical protein